MEFLVDMNQMHLFDKSTEEVLWDQLLVGNLGRTQKI